MGEAKRRKAKLGDLYGTPEGSNRPLIVYQGGTQREFDEHILTTIKAALIKGDPVLLVGDERCYSVAAAAGLPWLHNMDDPTNPPRSYAWNPGLFVEGRGPMLQPEKVDNEAHLILGHGSTKYLQEQTNMVHFFIPGSANTEQVHS